MAMEYIYLDRTTKEPVELKNFKGLRYFYEEECGDTGTLEILDARGEQVAFFRVKPYACYLLQRRNQSALQLHEMTPPRVFRDRVPWLFGFGRKQRCESVAQLEQACQEYRAAHPHAEVVIREISYYGSYLRYAFAVGEYTTPVAYCCKWAENGTWAFFGDDTICEFIADLDRELKFKFPLQYVIHQVKAMATTYPVPTKKFFQDRLGYYDKSVYYASDPCSGF